MDSDWVYFILGLVAYQIGKMLYLILEEGLRQRREKRFPKLVNITFPDKENITYISIHGSDKRTIKELEQELRVAQHHVSKDFPTKITYNK